MTGEFVGISEFLLGIEVKNYNGRNNQKITTATAIGACKKAPGH
jgi:hypothetical protein